MNDEVQYTLENSLLVAMLFNADGEVKFSVPAETKMEEDEVSAKWRSWWNWDKIMRRAGGMKRSMDLTHCCV